MVLPIKTNLSDRILQATINYFLKFNKEGVGVGTTILQPLSLTSSIEQTVPWGRVLIQLTNLDQGSCRSQSAGKFGTKAQI